MTNDMKSESALKNILNFTKIEHTAFSLPLIFTGAWLGAGNQFPSVKVMLLIVAAAVGARIFGMAMNRVFDRHIDLLNPRTASRELPAGKISLTTALFIAAGGLAFYLLTCWILGGWCLILSPIPWSRCWVTRCSSGSPRFAISVSGSVWRWRRWALMSLPPVIHDFQPP
jgi:4-hydroxybenzoate polyprenyltransferase